MRYRLLDLGKKEGPNEGKVFEALDIEDASKKAIAFLGDVVGDVGAKDYGGTWVDLYPYIEMGDGKKHLNVFHDGYKIVPASWKKV